MSFNKGDPVEYTGTMSPNILGSKGVVTNILPYEMFEVDFPGHNPPGGFWRVFGYNIKLVHEAQ